ncbi:MAG: anti-sigma-E factor ChrR [Oricola sp.]
MIENKIESMDALLARFVAGTLPRPVEVLVAAHLELSPANRALVRALECAAGELLENETPVPLADRDAMLEAVFVAGDPIPLSAGKADEAPYPLLPRALHDFVGQAVDEIPWKTKTPGFKEFEMGDVDGCHVSIMWLKPGRRMPAHTHEGMELTLVLDGAFADSKGRFVRGDITIADESVDHRPVAEKGHACIAFAVADCDLPATGSLHQRIADILGTK